MNFDLAPAGMQGFLNPLIDLIYYLGISKLSPRIYAFLLGSLQGLLFPALYFLSAEVLDEKTEESKLNPRPLFCAFLGLIGPDFVSLLGTSFPDSIISIPCVWSVYFMVRAIKSYQVSYGAVVGALVGVACGLKLTFLL